MKNAILIFSLFTQITLLAQVNPPIPPIPPIPPAEPTLPEEVRASTKEDTTKINLGDREILIINKKDNKKMKVEKEEEDDDDDDEMDKNDDQDDNDKMEGKNHKHHRVNKSPNKSHKGADVGFLNIDLGVNFLSNTKNINEGEVDNLNLKFWSWSTTFNFLPTRIYLGTKNVQLMSSFGWRIGRYKFENPLEFTPNKNLEYQIDSNIKTSTLSVHHLQIPLMVYVQSNKIKGLGRIGIGVGGYAGVNISESSRIKYEKIDRVVKTDEDFGFEKYRYGLSARVDVGAVKFFANLDMSDTWKDKEFRTLECGLWFDF
ncbi:MAG: outer membrane beta-barrel protein [Saprospiraceae bacterium]